MLFQRKKKYPLNHAADAGAPIPTQAEHTMPSDTDLTDALLEIENALANAFGESAETTSESEKDILSHFINNMEITNTLVYEGPRLRDAKAGETPSDPNADE